MKELEKINKQRRDSQAIKDRCCEFLQKLFDRKLDLLVGKTPSFDFEVAVRAIRAESKFFGAPREHACVDKEQKWPYFEAFRNAKLSVEEQEAILHDISLSKIEWATGDTIKSLRFTFSNGQTTTVLGERVNLEKSFSFPEKDEIG